jgi:uncharacterized membrane protein
MDQVMVDDPLYKWTRNALVAGMLFSLALIIAGLTLYIVSGVRDQVDFVPLDQLLPGVASGDPLGIITLGVMILALTPALSVLASLFGFLAVRDLRYALITTLVLLVLVLSIFLKF